MSNPLTKLLKQKQKADSYAFLDELSESDDELDLLHIDSLAVASSDADMDVDATGARVEQLLGSKDGQAVGKILTHDRDHKAADAKVCGVQFFNTKYAVAPQATQRAYIARLQGEDPTDVVFNVLKKAVHVNGRSLLTPALNTANHVIDAFKVEALLDAGILARVDPKNMPHCVRWLFDQGTTNDPTLLRC